MCRFLCGHKFSFCVNKCPGVIAGLHDKHVFEFLRNYSTIFHRGYTILHSTSSVWETYVLSILTTIWYFHYFLFSFSQMMWYLTWFQFAFPLWLIILSIFSCAIHISSLIKCLFMSIHFQLNCFFIFELWEFFIYSRYKSFVGNVVCK